MSKGEKFFVKAVWVTLALIVVSALVCNYAKENPLFAWAMFGGDGVFFAIVVRTKGNTLQSKVQTTRLVLFCEN